MSNFISVRRLSRQVLSFPRRTDNLICNMKEYDSHTGARREGKFMKNETLRQVAQKAGSLRLSLNNL